MTAQVFDRTASVKDVILKEPLAQMGKLVSFGYIFVVVVVCLLACFFVFLYFFYWGCLNSRLLVVL